MKINPISNHQIKNKPAFRAQVEIKWNNYDVVSGTNIDISTPKLFPLVQALVPKLQELDDNLEITISGVGKPNDFFNLFTKNRQGLKCDIRYMDVKKYYYESLFKDKYLESEILKPHTFKALRNKNKLLLNDALNQSVGVGKLFYEDKEETTEQYIAVLMAKLKEHIRLFPRLVTECAEFKYDKKNDTFVPRTIKSQDGRRSHQSYRGVEYDYDPIFISYYKSGFTFNWCYPHRAHKMDAKY